MNHMMNILAKAIHTALITLLILVMPVTAVTAEAQAEAALEMEAVVASVDPRTREVSLTATWLTFTLFVPKSLNLDNISVGDRVTGTYFFATLKADLRAPTDEELANPWEVVEEGGASGESIDAARLVRAVATVLAIDKTKGAIVITDSRDMTHFIANVEPEKLAALTVGQKVVVVFTEAMAVSLEKKS